MSSQQRLPIIYQTPSPPLQTGQRPRQKKVRISFHKTQALHLTTPDDKLSTAATDDHMMASVKPVDGIMEELNQPSALFLGNPALLSELMEWIDDGRMS